MIWYLYIALIAVLAIPSDGRHRVALGLVAGGLIALGYLAGNISAGAFFIAQGALWIGVASLIGATMVSNGWSSMLLGAILLVVAGVTVLPAWLFGDALAPFSSVSLIVSDICGVGAIVAFGTPGIKAGIGRFRDMVYNTGNRFLGNRMAGGARTQASQAKIKSERTRRLHG